MYKEISMKSNFFIVVALLFGVSTIFSMELNKIRKEIEKIDDELYKSQKQAWLNVIQTFVKNSIDAVIHKTNTEKAYSNCTIAVMFAHEKTMQMEFDSKLITLFDEAYKTPVLLGDSIESCFKCGNDEIRFCPLLYAAYEGNVELLQAVLQHEPSTTTKYKETDLTLSQTVGELIKRNSSAYFNDTVRIFKLLQQYERKQKIKKEAKEIDIEAQSSGL